MGVAGWLYVLVKVVYGRCKTLGLSLAVLRLGSCFEEALSACASLPARFGTLGRVGSIGLLFSTSLGGSMISFALLSKSRPELHRGFLSKTESTKTIPNLQSEAS